MNQVDQGDHHQVDDPLDPPDLPRAFGLLSRQSLLPEETDRDLITADTRMFSDIGQDTRKRADVQGIVTRNGEMMLAVFLSRQTHVTTALPYDLIAEGFQQPGKRLSR